MAKYIEREQAIKIAESYGLKNGSALGRHSGIADCIAEAISVIPSAEVVTVRHGRWEEMHYEGGILDGTNFDRCSVCGYERVFDDPALKTVFKYCPNCGAKMDGWMRK